MKELSVWYLYHSFHYSQPRFNHIAVNKGGKSLEMASKTMEPKDKRDLLRVFVNTGNITFCLIHPNFDPNTSHGQRSQLNQLWISTDNCGFQRTTCQKSFLVLEEQNKCFHFGSISCTFYIDNGVIASRLAFILLILLF